ncbi:MAG TPA: UbiA family prenyltransferase [Nitrospiraceae bacterium]|nr:UbiA family prenyltransferase [Nitrospiraceae bacterium]
MDSRSMRLPIERVTLLLRLGRVSNLPTVWTNTMAGVVLAGGNLSSIEMPTLIVAFTCFYTGGMFLNDAFDRDSDRHARPDRPIPAGLIPAEAVFVMGYGMVLLGSTIVIVLGMGKGWAPAVSAVALGTAIVSYDAYHKQNPFGPWIMALCRALIYITVAAVINGHINATVIAGAAMLFAYVTGLTYAAKRRDTLPSTVGRLIAGIALVDAALMVGLGALGAACLAVLAFALTRRWQRMIQGT